MHMFFTSPQQSLRNQTDLASYCIHTTLDGIERVAMLNLSTARSAVEMALSSMSGLTGAKDLRVITYLHKHLTPALEQGAQYTRNFIEINSNTRHKIAERVENKIAEQQNEFHHLIERSLDQGPLASQKAVSMVKSAIRATTDTLEGINEAAKRAGEMAEASANAVATATAQTATKLYP